MPQASEALSVAALFAEREARRRSEQEAAERLQRRKEEELTAYKQRLENFHLVDDDNSGPTGAAQARLRARGERVDVWRSVPLRLLH